MGLRGANQGLIGGHAVRRWRRIGTGGTPPFVALLAPLRHRSGHLRALSLGGLFLGLFLGDNVQVLDELLVFPHLLIVFVELPLRDRSDERFRLGIDLLELAPPLGDDAREFEEAYHSVLLAVFALLPLSGPGVPVRTEPGVAVADRNIGYANLPVGGRLIGVVSREALDDVLALELEKNVIAGQRPHGLLGGDRELVASGREYSERRRSTARSIDLGSPLLPGGGPHLVDLLVQWSIHR
mmetsp:Transcript_4225/g.9458  ORF Transcript_4225/g.9458 Transcript_4225/m.9458 type:complete len:240 (-) Transcript_4225:176-895(-)